MISRTSLKFVAAAVVAAAGNWAVAQPVLTSLGGRPSTVSNPQSGSYYVGGSNVRWTLNGASLSSIALGGSAGGGLISADGAYITGALPNNGAISGNTAACIAPFTIPTAFAPFTLTPAADLIAARWSAAGPTIAGLPGFPNDATSQALQVFGSGDSGLVHAANCMSQNGRFIGIQGYTSTYTTSAATITIASTNGIVCSGGVATATTTAAHLLAAGNTVTIAGNSVAGYNGTWVIASVPTATTFTFSVACGATGNGGSIALAAGQRITASQNFRFRGGIWDANTNTMRVLSTPFRTTSQTTRRRDGTTFAVSNDGLVVVGAQEHNSGTVPASTDPDGGRPVVWMWNGSDYIMSFLPNGVNGSGFPITYSMTAGDFAINAAGTIIVGKAVDNSGLVLYIAKWVWNAGTSSWDPPINIGSNLSSPASWLPVAVTSCGQPPSLRITGMSDDGNTIVGAATYSTCGSFMTGGWIWTNADGLLVDWYDYLNAKGVAGLAPGAGSTWGPIGDGSPTIDYTKGLPRLGNPSGISPDGSAVVGSQGGTQVIVGAQPWILVPTGSTCLAPAIVTNPAATANFSRCNRFVNLSCAASGSSIAFQWYRANGGSPIALTDGVNGNGMQIIGAQTAAPSLIDPTPADADSYYCVVTGSCGSPAQTTGCTVQVDPSIPALANGFNDCSGADASAGVGEGTYPFNPCAQFEPAINVSCVSTTFTRGDVWFKYVPTFTGEARFQTCAGTYDSNVTLWSACGGFEMACNDDIGAGFPSPCNGTTRSRISRYNVTVGVPVLVRVAGTGTALTATGSLQILQAPAHPANDDCGNATVLTPRISLVPITVTATYDLLEATGDGSSSCAVTAPRDIWYKFTPPARATVRAMTCTASPQVDTVLSFLQNCFPGAEWPSACNDNQSGAPAPCGSTQSMIDNFAVPQINVGGPIYIRLAQKSLSTTTTGTFTLRVTWTCPADYDGNGAIEPADVAAFINTWFDSLAAPNLQGDFDGNGIVEPADVAAFVNTWFAGLSNPC